MESGSRQEQDISLLAPYSYWQETESQRNSRLQNLAQMASSDDPLGPSSTSPSLSHFTPHLMFFYGTLSLPHILKGVLGLSYFPVLRRARVLSHGYSVKMWGPYPALVKNPDDDITAPAINQDLGPAGMTYTITEEKDLQRLRQFEGENYKLVSCELVQLDPEGDLDSETQRTGWTFVWNSYLEDLTEGAFDASLFPVRDPVSSFWYDYFISKTGCLYLVLFCRYDTQ